MNHRHEKRYKRAVARITPERRERIAARALKELGLLTMPKMFTEQEPVLRLIAMKLGERFGV